MDVQKGQKIKLSDIMPSTKFTAEIEIEMSQGEADISCFGVDSENKLSDDKYFIFYNQLSSPENAIRLEQSGKNNKFQISLDNLPKKILKLVFTIASEGSTTMKSIKKGYFRITDGTKTLLQYQFDGSIFENQKAIILSEIYFKADAWRVSMVSNGFNGGLSALLAFFGGEEEKPSEKNAIKPQKETLSPIAPPPVQKQAENEPPPKAINLKKNGDAHKINLKKNNGTIHANLNWTQNIKKGLFSSNKGIDLDLACMFRLKNGMQGVIQALGNSFGSDMQPPFIKLDKDDRTGNSTNGENMFFSKPDQIDFAIVFAFIYEGVPNWKMANASITLFQSGMPDIGIQLDSSSGTDRFCVFASLQNKDGQLEVKREELYFRGHREIDQHYGFGFRWQGGSK